MIYTDMEHLGTYRGIAPALDTAIAYLQQHGTDGLTAGRNEVDGDNVFINRFAYTTMPEAETAFEAHRRYLDIHLVVEGEELIGIAPIGTMTVTGEDVENDGIDCTGETEAWLPMAPGKVLIAFPEDAHRVKVQKNDPCHVEKAVVKVLIER